MLSRAMPRITALMLVLLVVEFLDEFVFGTREAAWPLIRTDLGLSYVQIGLLLSVPSIVGDLVKPGIGILGDVWRRRWLVLGGGVARRPKGRRHGEQNRGQRRNDPVSSNH